MKKFLALMLSFFVLLSIIIPSAFAVDNLSPKFIVSDEKGEVGETVAVQISLQNNPGITALQLIVDYSEDNLELVSVQDEGLFNDAISSSKITTYPFKISWYSQNSLDETESGVLATLNFKIKDNAESSEVKLTYDENNVFDSNFDNIYFDVKSGVVEVSNVDSVLPRASISSTNNISSTQSATLIMSDDTGVVSYYWGTSSSPANSLFTSVESTASKSVVKTVSNSGTYYLIVKDADGNTATDNATFYKTTLNANGGNVSPTSILTNKGNSVVLPTPTKINCEFLGWGTSASATSGATSITPTSNRTYYALWNSTSESKPTVTITSTNGVSTYQNVRLSLSDNIGVVGYYWGTDSSPSSDEFRSITSNTTANIEVSVSESGTYYAIAKNTNGKTTTSSVTFYETTLDACGGSVYPKNIITMEGNSIDLPTPKLSGSKFNGWGTSASDISGLKSVKPTSNATCYATWIKAVELLQPVEYKAEISNDKKIAYYTFKPNFSHEYVIYSTGDNDYKVSLFDSKDVLIASDDNSGTDYNFRLAYNLTGGKPYFYIVEFTDDTECGTIPFAFGKVVTISYDSNGGNTTPSSQKKDVFTDITLSEVTPTKSGYKFLGWATSNTAIEPKYQPGARFTLNTSVTLYAVWETDDSKPVDAEPTVNTTESMIVTDPIEDNSSSVIATEPSETVTSPTVVTDSIEEPTDITEATNPTNTVEMPSSVPNESETTTITELATGETPNTDVSIPVTSTTSTNDQIEPSEPIENMGILGDVNNDGKVNIKDATLIQKAAAKITELTDEENLRANVNSDAKVNVKDATAIQKFAAKIETGYPIGKPIE